MFFKKIKNNILLTLIFTLLIIPNYALAYSDYIVAGGENIGIELNSKGVIIVGTYKIGNNDPSAVAKLQSGDRLVSIENENVNNNQTINDT